MQIDIVSIVDTVCFFYSMLAKYSEFPEKLLLNILFGITIWLPPLLLLLVLLFIPDP
jgi:hypothetical protein